MTFVSTIIAIAVITITAMIYIQVLGLSSSLHTPFDKMVITLVSIVIPVSLGILIKQRFPRVAKAFVGFVKPFTVILIAISLYIGFKMGTAFIQGINKGSLLIGILVPQCWLLLCQVSKIAFSGLPNCCY